MTHITSLWKFCKELFGVRRSRVVTFTAIRLRGPGLKPRPGQKFENENFCFNCTPAVVKAFRGHKKPLYKTWIPILFGPTLNIPWPTMNIILVFWFSRYEPFTHNKMFSHNVFVNKNLLTPIVLSETVQNEEEELCSGLFCDGMCWYGVPGNENDESIFCMSVLY